MKKNLGNLDRAFRAVGAVVMIVCALIAPWSLAVRAGLFGGTALYLLYTALAGTCLGYRFMGMSTCPVEHR